MITEPLFKVFPSNIVDEWMVCKREGDQWTGLAFHLSNSDAATLANQWNGKEDHILAVPHRVSWAWDSSVKVDRQRHIDIWYNSLTPEQRSFVDDIRDDAYSEGSRNDGND